MERETPKNTETPPQPLEQSKERTLKDVSELTPEQRQTLESLQQELITLAEKRLQLEDEIATNNAQLEPMKAEIRGDLLDLRYLEESGLRGFSGKPSDRTAEEIKKLKNKITIKLSGLRKAQSKVDVIVQPLRAEHFAISRLMAIKRAAIRSILEQ